MAKIFSILTLLAAGLALYLGLESGKRVKDLQDAGLKTKNKLVQTETVLKSTEEKLKATEDELTQTKSTLETTRAELATAKQNLDKATSELTAAKTELDQAKMQLAGIQKTLEDAGLGANIAEGVNNLKNSITALTDKVKENETKIAALEKEKAELNTTVETLTANVRTSEDKIASQGRTIKKYTDNIMEKGIRGRVMAVNSGWGFCVLSVGDRQGAAANKIMIVARGGQAIGKVRITNVEATQSVADILPGTFIRGQYVQPGDDVIYTGDDKVQAEEPAAAAATTPAAGPVVQPPLPQ
jgi:predicted  nucleic acid-binding Zn-ribbon protein